MINLIADPNLKKEIATKVLHDLPTWFGIPEYTNNYIQESMHLPFIAIYKNEDPIGFISVKETSPYTAEIYCMGILKAYHHQGYGRKLHDFFITYAISKGYHFLQVKTVEQGNYDSYDKTNAFYESLGYKPFEVFPELWDKWNPCQVYIMSIKK